MDILYPIVELEKALAYIEAIEENDDIPYDHLEWIKTRISKSVEHLYGTHQGAEFKHRLMKGGA